MSEWIEWPGGECPVDKKTPVIAKNRLGFSHESLAGEFFWGRNGNGSSGDIVAYRHVQLTNPPTIEQLAADYREKLAIAKQAQEEADSHRCGAEVALSRLENACAELGFTIWPLVADEPQPTGAPDIADWRNLAVGDIIECAGDGWAPCSIGKLARIIELDFDDAKFPINARSDDYEVDDWGSGFKFIRRPSV